LGVPLRFLGWTRFWTRGFASTMPLLAAYCLPTREILVKFQTFWVPTQGRVGLLTAYYSANLGQPQEMADRRSLGHFSGSSFPRDSSLTGGRSLFTLRTIWLTVSCGSSHPGFFYDNFRSIREIILTSLIITTSDVGYNFWFDNDGALQT
jgi:hypothetical protein